MKLKKISLSKVLKLELPELINDVIRIVEKHDPDLFGLRGRFNELKEHQQKIKLLEVPPIAHPLTAELELLREKELQCAGAIVSHMRFVVRIDIAIMRNAANIADLVVRRYLVGLRKNNENVINETLHQFFKHLDLNPEVYQALYSLGLQPFVDEMRKTNAEKLVMIKERESYKLNKGPKVDGRLIQKEAQNALSWMFEMINISRNYENQSQYDSLVKELNVLLTRYATIINTRKTHNKKLAAKKSKKKTSSTSKVINRNETTSTLLSNIIEALKLRNLGKT